MQQFFNVTLPWAWSGDAGGEEGTYSTTVAATGADDARRAAAEEMADSGDMTFVDDAERQRYIDSRFKGWADVYATADQLKQDLMTVFASELFPDGVARAINLEAIGRLLSDHRQAVLA